MRTPGPWVAVGIDVHDKVTKFDEQGARIGDTANIVAAVGYPYGDRDGQEANAKAIAAVPDLIEALKAFLVKPSIGMDRELILAKAALTKAGETL